MSEMLEHVEYLSQKVGPRPAGTEEEQEAALYIAERLQKETGLPAVVEDFDFALNTRLLRAVCSIVVFASALLGIFIPVLMIPAIVLSAVATVIYVIESFDRPLLSRFFGHGVSQNVVAKFEPTSTAENPLRRRKIILLAHYDSGKVRHDMKKPWVTLLPFLRIAEVIAFLVVVVFLFIHGVIVPNIEGVGLVVFNIITIVAAVCSFLPFLAFLLNYTSTFSNGANCNGAGVGVLMEAAYRVATGSVRTTDEDYGVSGEAIIHGEDVARKQGLVPEGAEIVYEAANLRGPDIPDESPEDRLLAAKAAIAALTGKPVSSTVNVDLSKNLVKVNDQPMEAPTSESMHASRTDTLNAFAPVNIELQADPADVEYLNDDEVIDQPKTYDSARIHHDAMPQPAVQAVAPSTRPPAQSSAVPARSDNLVGSSSMNYGPPVITPHPSEIPSWYRTAQQKARKKEGAAPVVQRSRYAEALEAFERESRQRMAQTSSQESLTETDARLQAVRDNIMGVQAPTFADLSAATQQEVVNQQPQTMSAAAPQAHDSIMTETDPLAQEAQAFNQIEKEVSAETYIDNVVEETSEQPVIDAQQEKEIINTKAQAAEAVLDHQVQEEEHLAPDQTIAITPTPIYDEDVIAEREYIPIEVTGERRKVASSKDEDAKRRTRPKRPQRAITLPEMSQQDETLTPLSERQKQRAPLAQLENEKQGASSRRSGMRSTLPTITGSISHEAHDSSDQRPLTNNPALLDALPSLSGAIDIDDDETLENTSSNVSVAGSFAPVGMTGSFTPVGDELLEDVDPDDIYVDDVDDSDYDVQFTETGAYAGPGYVEMPKSKTRRFLDRLHIGRKKREQEVTPQEWLDVDADFDAQTVGAERGNWESFQQENNENQPRPPRRRQQRVEHTAYHEHVNEYSKTEDDDPDVFDYYEDPFTGDDSSIDGEEQEDRRHWNGGAASRQEMKRRMQKGRKGSKTSDINNDGSYEPGDEFAPAAYENDEQYFDMNDYEPDFEDVFTDGFEDDAIATDGLTESPDTEAVEKLSQEQAEPIYRFYNPKIKTEVWFVALGAQLADNAGMRAFLEEHASELKGSIFIELDALGDGDLTSITREGELRIAKTTSRMNRYLRKASQATGVNIADGEICWGESASSYAIKQGYQSMHLVGMKDGVPAHLGQADDVIDNINEEKLQANADFVMELLRII